MEQLPESCWPGVIFLSSWESSPIVFGLSVDPFLMCQETVAVSSLLTKSKSYFAPGDPISSFELSFQTVSQASQGRKAVEPQQTIRLIFFSLKHFNIYWITSVCIQG